MGAGTSGSGGFRAGTVLRQLLALAAAAVLGSPIAR